MLESPSLIVNSEGLFLLLMGYLSALTIPNLLSLMIGGALGTPFLSVFVARLAQGRRDEGWRMASSILNPDRRDYGAGVRGGDTSGSGTDQDDGSGL